MGRILLPYLGPSFHRLRYRLQGLWYAKPRRRPVKLPPDNAELRHISFTFAVIALSARVATADGKLTREKYLTFRDTFPLSGGVCDKIRSLFVLACENKTPVEHYISHIRHAFPRQKNLYLSLLERLFAVACANGKLSADSDTLLTRIAHGLGVSAANFADIHTRYARTPIFKKARAQRVLGLDAHADTATLKARYRELMRRYHPDRFGGIKLSEEMEMLLAFKTAEISEAYRRLSKKAA